MKPPSQDDFLEAFKSRFSPIFAEGIVKLIDDCAVAARRECARMFPSGNFAVEQGVNRRKMIEDGVRGSYFSGLTIEPRSFKGQLLLADEPVSNFNLIRGLDVGLVICKASTLRPMPQFSRFRAFLAQTALEQRPILTEPNGIDKELALPKAFFFLRYFLDPLDRTRSKVDEIDVVVPSRRGTSILYPVVNLREYASQAIIPSSLSLLNSPLPIAFRDDPESNTGTDDSEVK